MNAVLSIGAKARSALQASGGSALPLAQFPDAPYFDAAGEIIWVGSRLPARHPRAVLTAAPVLRGQAAQFGALPLEAWSATRPSLQRARCGAVRTACRRLVASADLLGRPLGFGALLAGSTPAFPLDLAVARVDTLVAGYREDDANAVHAASRALLGLGTGLTPSGDDLCGGALFGRMLTSRDARWRTAGAQLVEDTQSASHVISAALFADLVAGASFEPLHALADALVVDDNRAAIDAARTLVRLGHSSGWDMLTGLVIGITGRLAS